MRIALLHSRIRVEEKLLADELARRAVDHEVIDARSCIFDIHDPAPWRRFDCVLERCIGQTQALAAVRIFEAFGIPCVNPGAVIEACGDKLTTSLRLARAGVPTPRVLAAVDEAAAVEAVERMGYPCVLKPTTGSWGRLLARVNDRDAAEAVVEHKATLGGPQHGVFYVQEHIDKPDRDLRVFMVAGRAVAAIARSSDHWITNTARGGRAEGVEITPALADLCARAAAAVCAGEASNTLLAIDLLETPGGEMLVSEVNHTMEFRNSIEPTRVDIPALMIEHVLNVAHAARAAASTRPASVAPTALSAAGVLA